MKRTDKILHSRCVHDQRGSAAQETAAERQGFVVCRTGTHMLAENEADARLIAAAPDMYEALKDLLVVMCAGAGQGMTEAKRTAAIAKARAVIAKAEGRS